MFQKTKKYDMKIKKIRSSLVIVALLLLECAGNIKIASAADPFAYKMLEGLPGFFNRGTAAPSLPELISAIYKFGIWTIGIAALLMITIGGFMYMTSAGNTSSLKSAKGIITDALVGLAAAMFSFVFLYVINPELTKINLDLVKTSVNDSGPPLPPANPAAPGCAKVSDFARSKVNVWKYYPRAIPPSTKVDPNGWRGKTINGVRYTDCSELAGKSLEAASCDQTALTAKGYYDLGHTFTGPADLKAGDIVARLGTYSNHVVICANDGCMKIIHAAGVKKNVVEEANANVSGKKGEWAQARVVKVADLKCSC